MPFGIHNVSVGMNPEGSQPLKYYDFDRYAVSLKM